MELPIAQILPIVVAFLMALYIILCIFIRRHTTRRYLYYSNLEPVLANLGFLFQFSGTLMLPSVAFAYYSYELTAGEGLILTSAVLLGLGFLLGFLFEPKMPNIKQSCLLLVLFYTIYPLIMCIPLLYMGIFKGSLLDQFVDCLFETSSAFSTTGLTLLDGITVPKSLILARGITEWSGGIGVVFILLPAFYPNISLSQYGKILGVEKFTGDYRGSFLAVALVYGGYTLLFTLALILAGVDSFMALHTILTVYSTTGLTMVDVLTLPVPAVVIITLSMLASALSFPLHLKIISFFSKPKLKALLRGDWKTLTLLSTKNSSKPFLTKEIKLYFILIFIFTFALWRTSNIDLFRAFFHCIDFSTSVGLGILDFEELSELGKNILVVIMFIGPTSYSIGGGIRVLRLHILGKVLANLPNILLKGEMPKVEVDGEPLTDTTVILHLLIIFLFALLSFFSALILCNYGYSLTDALVESVSAITTTGDSPKILTPLLPLVPKFLLIILMLVGRFEIIPVFAAFSRIAEPRRSE